MFVSKEISNIWLPVREQSSERTARNYICCMITTFIGYTKKNKLCFTPLCMVRNFDTHALDVFKHAFHLKTKGMTSTLLVSQ